MDIVYCLAVLVIGRVFIMLGGVIFAIGLTYSLEYHEGAGGHHQKRYNRAYFRSWAGYHVGIIILHVCINSMDFWGSALNERNSADHCDDQCNACIPVYSGLS